MSFPATMQWHFAGQPASSYLFEAVFRCLSDQRETHGHWRPGALRDIRAAADSWSGVRVAEGAALEMRCAGNRTEGSNPSRSVLAFCTVAHPALEGAQTLYLVPEPDGQLQEGRQGGVSGEPAGRVGG